MHRIMWMLRLLFVLFKKITKTFSIMCGDINIWICVCECVLDIWLQMMGLISLSLPPPPLILWFHSHRILKPENVIRIFVSMQCDLRTNFCVCVWFDWMRTFKWLLTLCLSSNLIFVCLWFHMFIYKFQAS
jgi:hypothetical protein